MLAAIQQVKNLTFVIALARQANMRRCDPTLPVNKERRRQRIDSSVKPRHLVCAYRNAVVHLMLLNERLNHLQTAVIHGNPEHGETAVLIFLLKLDEPRNLDLAGTAPSGPEVKQSTLPL